MPAATARLGLTGGTQPFPQVGLINTQYAKELASPHIEKAIVLTQLRRSSTSDGDDLGAGLDVPGTLYYDPWSLQIVKANSFSTSDILVIDGNHRIASAYYHGRNSVNGVLLRMTDLTRYLQN